jgi:uncharacterized phage-like protein YoqJ
MNNLKIHRSTIKKRTDERLISTAAAGQAWFLVSGSLSLKHEHHVEAARE